MEMKRKLRVMEVEEVKFENGSVMQRILFGDPDLFVQTQIFKPISMAFDLQATDVGAMVEVVLKLGEKNKKYSLTPISIVKLAGK